MTKALLFDLDGTLADTAPDLLAALNAVRHDAGLAPAPMLEFRASITGGTPTMLQYGLGVGSEDPEFSALRQAFLGHYQTNLDRHTKLFSGIVEVLAALDERDMAWGIVTNKIGRFADPLIAALGLSKRSACNIYGDSAEHPKPHAAPLLLAAERLGVAPAECIYIGDALTDVVAASNAGMPCWVASYGYLGPEDRPETWSAARLLEHPGDILEILNEA